MRAFPLWYEFNSVYAMFPFTVPEKTARGSHEIGNLVFLLFRIAKTTTSFHCTSDEVSFEL